MIPEMGHKVAVQSLLYCGRGDKSFYLGDPTCVGMHDVPLALVCPQFKPHKQLLFGCMTVTQVFEALCSEIRLSTSSLVK